MEQKRWSVGWKERHVAKEGKWQGSQISGSSGDTHSRVFLTVYRSSSSSISLPSLLPYVSPAVLPSLRRTIPLLLPLLLSFHLPFIFPPLPSPPSPPPPRPRPPLPSVTPLPSSPRPRTIHQQTSAENLSVTFPTKAIENSSFQTWLLTLFTRWMVQFRAHGNTVTCTVEKCCLQYLKPLKYVTPNRYLPIELYD